MKPIMLTGLVLIALGIGALAHQGITYTSREKSIDIGPFQASADTRKIVRLPAIVGSVAIACGVGLFIFGRRKS